ncbi:tRNA uridine(34) 5-carboxymethylaminomethyl modification radical SAM/GNAT enzyme Elp3 [Patescibacteria group bacterium]|nr:tRNA uridine(34) 5-carboxymethylaminomethyl modification radical SAM/GNAT enzyme Elp3 [Patescibacteria group bacterium]
MDKFELAIIYLIKSKIKSLSDLDSIKRKISKKLGIITPSNVDLLKAYHKLVKKKRIKPDRKIEILLIKRRIRSLSGIVNVSVLTKPYACPGKCLYCPEQEGVPKSYLKREPAVQRAILNNFDPYLQVQTRLESLKATGHPVDKIELRIIGGTWSYYPKAYQTEFVLQCFNACNSKKLRSLEKAQKLNEKAKSRITGLTIETRPDYINEKEIKRLRELGITRVELGVQSIYNDVLKLNRRDHLIEETIKATKLLKDAGFKISYQMMPNLPGSSFKRDVEMFKELFSNSDFQPDLLKIYPLALLKEAPLYKWYKKNKYKPYNEKQLIKLLIEIKKHIPYYVRIERIIRDIPADYIIEGGVKISNLREVIQKEVKCKCIRCREVKEFYSKEKLYLYRQDYDSSGGKEVFLSFENKDRTHLYSLLKLRILNNEVGPRCKAIVREIHTYGQMAQIKNGRGPSSTQIQHKGLGKKLMEKAEDITKNEFGLDKLGVISGIGVRGYYRKLGYHLQNTYMIKSLD